MPCTPFQIDGARGFICSRTPRPRCACGQPAMLQCDAPTRRSTGTCDRHLCQQHAGQEVPPVQGDLFGRPNAAITGAGTASGA